MADKPVSQKEAKGESPPDDTMLGDGQVKKVSESEMEQAFAGAAFAVNKTVATSTDNIRLAFLELDGEGNTHFRTAVSMSIAQAVQLRKLLSRVTADFEQFMEEVQAEEEARAQAEKKDA